MLSDGEPLIQTIILVNFINLLEKIGMYVIGTQNYKAEGDIARQKRKEEGGEW